MSDSTFQKFNLFQLKKHWPLLVGILFFGGLIVYRSVTIPFTHDEASTWLNYRHLDVWSCLTNPKCWGSGNNHWLNTLLLQWSSDLFGDIPWALRLPNVIAGILYLICAALFSIRYIERPLFQMTGFLLLAAHVYLLDFFSLARGYGLMASGVLWSIYALMRYVEKGEWRWLLGAVISISIAVLGNFTALLPWAALALGWLIWIWMTKQYRLLFRHGVVWLVSALVLILLLRFPILMLAKAGEFGWGSTGLWTMLIDLISQLLYGFRYFGKHSVIILLWVVVMITSLIFGVAMFRKESEQRKTLMVAGVLLLANFLVIIFHQQLTGTQAPIGRKTIYLIPFLVIPLSLGLNMIRHRMTGLIVGWVVSGALFLHVMDSYPWSAVREWYYDAYYPELFSTVLPKGPDADSIRIGSSWIFNPALSFYQKTKPLPMTGLAYQRPLELDTTMQYYFVEASDSTGMYTNGFVLQKPVGPFYLFKRMD